MLSEAQREVLNFAASFEDGFGGFYRHALIADIYDCEIPVLAKAGLLVRVAAPLERYAITPSGRAALAQQEKG